MIIFGSPRRYIQGPDAIGRLGEEIARIGKSALLLADAHVGELVGATAEGSCRTAGVSLAREVFGDGGSAQAVNTPRVRQATPATTTTASTPAFRNPFDTPPQGT